MAEARRKTIQERAIEARIAAIRLKVAVSNIGPSEMTPALRQELVTFLEAAAAIDDYTEGLR